jgi:Skp family chaperone for outer membrane proteins
MKKQLLLLLAFCSTLAATAQTRGLKVAYIDMEYILEKVPDYADAKNQLEQKAQKWKQEIEAKKNDINKLKDNLKTERVLLTKELIQEREDEITFQENELITYQDKRFGPKGDLISQKAVLVKPIQDQVFNAIQDISEAKKLDFVFDKSSDMTMLYAAKRHDISDQVIRRLTRAAKREQLSGKEIKQLEKQEAQEDLEDDPDFQDKKKIQEDKKAERQRLIDERKAAAQKKREEQLARREQQKQEREAKKAGNSPVSNSQPSNPGQNNSDLEGEDTDTNTNRPAVVPGTNPTLNSQPVQGENSNQVKTTATPVPEEGSTTAVERQKAAQEERQRKLDERKQAAEARKQKILADREAAKKAREDKKNQSTEENKNEN